MRDVANHPALDIQGCPGQRTKRRHDEPGPDDGIDRANLCREQSVTYRATRRQLWEGEGACSAINHTNTTGSHISGYHYGTLSRLELF